MKAQIKYPKKQFLKVLFLSIARSKDICLQFSFGFVIWLSIGAIFSPQAYANSFQSSDLVQSPSDNSCFFRLNPFTTFRITENSRVLLNTNLTINSNMRGEGSLILSSQERIFIDANNKKIRNLIIQSKTKVRLKGHLQIMRKICIQGKGKITLGDFNLVLLPATQIDMSMRKQIVKTGIGCIVNSNQRSNLLSTFPNYTNLQSTIGILTTINNGSLQGFSSSYSAFVSIWMFSDFYLEMGTPPPIFC
jgi:hypothetical protein